MHTNPKENRTQPDQILIEQFVRKGYSCKEVEEKDATVFIITCGKKDTTVINQIMNENYKKLLGNN